MYLFDQRYKGIQHISLYLCVGYLCIFGLLRLFWLHDTLTWSLVRFVNISVMFSIAFSVASSRADNFKAVMASVKEAPPSRSSFISFMFSGNSGDSVWNLFWRSWTAACKSLNSCCDTTARLRLPLCPLSRNKKL